MTTKKYLYCLTTKCPVHRTCSRGCNITSDRKHLSTCWTQSPGLFLNLNLKTYDTYFFSFYVLETLKIKYLFSLSVDFTVTSWFLPTNAVRMHGNSENNFSHLTLMPCSLYCIRRLPPNPANYFLLIWSALWHHISAGFRLLIYVTSL